MKAYLSLGSNIGDRKYYLDEAIRRLSSYGIRIIAVSGVYETEPWGGVEQAEFWNQVIEIETVLEPLELLHVCQGIEKALGRERIIHWGPRTVDIDILLYDNRVSASAELTLPHPYMEKRAFVLTPLREIAPEMVLPSGRSIQEVTEEGKVRYISEAGV